MRATVALTKALTLSAKLTSYCTLVGHAGRAQEPDIIFVGEAPGADEDSKRLPFVGASGQLLNTLLTQAGINRFECYFTNVVKVRPIGNNISPFLCQSRGNLKRHPAFDAWMDVLAEELRQVEGNLIVALGATAMHALVDLSPTGIMKRRGSLYESRAIFGQRKVLVSIHPSAVLREYMLRYPFIADLVRAKEQSLFPEIKRPKRKVNLPYSASHAVELIDEISASSSIVGFDIEVVREELFCLAIASSPNSAAVIPFYNKQFMPLWGQKMEVAVLTALARLLANPKIVKVMQNAIFDTNFMLRKYGMITRNIEDTMIAHKILLPDFPKGLDFMTAEYTEEPYYKDEGKKWAMKGNINQFWEYNAKDAMVTLEVWLTLRHDIEKQGNWETYTRQRALIDPLLFMEERGIPIDIEAKEAAALAAQEKINLLTAQLHEAVGWPLNEGSLHQMKRHFYKEKGHKPYINRKTKSTTLDKRALKRLVTKGDKEAAKVLEIRTVTKMFTTYWSTRIDSDNRVRCSFDPVGTEQGRISSSENIFGTGMNMQNLPPAFKHVLYADPGYILYEIDLAQAENRCVAFISGDPAMMDAFKSGTDIHRLTASAIYEDKPVEEVTDAERSWGKRANHALNYGMGEGVFAVDHGIPWTQARDIRNAYFKLYPNVQPWWAALKSQIFKDRTLTNCLGRRRVFKGYIDNILLKEAYSFQPQSTVADKLNRDGLCYVYYDAFFDHVELLNQIHDSIVFQIPISAGATYHAEVLCRITKSLESSLSWQGRDFSIPAEVKAGKRLGYGNMVDIPHDQFDNVLERVA